jgi:hypothetical protein
MEIVREDVPWIEPPRLPNDCHKPGPSVNSKGIGISGYFAIYYAAQRK